MQLLLLPVGACQFCHPARVEPELQSALFTCLVEKLSEDPKMLHQDDQCTLCLCMIHTVSSFCCWGPQKTDSQSGNAPERAMKKTLSSRGNKTTLLFKQLPDVPTET